MLEERISQTAVLESIKQRYAPECLWNAEKALKNWERYGGFEAVRDLFLKTIFDEWRFVWKFSTEAFILDGTIDRYHLIGFLVREGGVRHRKSSREGH